MRQRKSRAGVFSQDYYFEGTPYPTSPARYRLPARRPGNVGHNSGWRTIVRQELIPRVLDLQTLVARQENRPENDGASKNPRSSFTRYLYLDSHEATVYPPLGLINIHCKWHRYRYLAPSRGIQAAIS